MTLQRCLQQFREIKDVSFATVDAQGAPQVRIIDIMLVSDHALYFCTARGKDFYHELLRDERVAVTALSKNYEMLRLNGRARRLNDRRWIDRIFDENPSMNTVYPGDSREILDPFIIDEGRLEYFNLSVTPIFRESFSLDAAEPKRKGFVITDACIGCGRCAAVCPQQCIAEGSPYAITQSHCLHCGRCAEQCPVNAIERKEYAPC